MRAANKLPIVPSRGTQVLIKQRISTANNGFNLLKRKRDALEVKLKECSDEVNAHEGALEKMLKKSYLGLAKAKFLGFDQQSVLHSGSDHSTIMLSIKYRNVFGIKLPYFEVVNENREAYALAGLGKGGQQLIIIRRDFQEVLHYVAELASLQYSVVVLKKNVRDTKVRVNGLKYVLIPKLCNTLGFISEELDEMEREDLYRIKMSKAKLAMKRI